MSRIFIKPVAGMTIPSPDHNKQALPAEGAWVKPSSYWNRRLDAQEVTEAKPKKESGQ